MIRDSGVNNARFASTYVPRDDDVIITGYPKSGTTWAQYIVSSIFTDGNPPKTTLDFMLSSPIIEIVGDDGIRKMRRPGAFKTHFPHHMITYSTRAKYIYITRNPYDCCVSYYHFFKQFTPRDKELSFDSFLNLFLSGNHLLHIDYFEHLLSWYPHRNDLNVLLLTYEDLKKDTPHWVLRIADFLGKEYGSGLRGSESLLQKVLDSCSAQSMRTVLTDSTSEWMRKELDLPPEKRIASLEVYRNNPVYKTQMRSAGGFVRKACVGDWRSTFSSEQVERMKAKIAEKTAGTPEIMSIWKDLQLSL